MSRVETQNCASRLAVCADGEDAHVGACEHAGARRLLGAPWPSGAACSTRRSRPTSYLLDTGCKVRVRALRDAQDSPPPAPVCLPRAASCAPGPALVV